MGHVFYASISKLLAENKIDEAINELGPLLAAPLQDETVLSLYSNALTKKGEKAKALEVLSEGLDQYPGSLALHTDMAFLAKEMGDKNRAINSFEVATAQKNDFYIAHCCLEQLYFETQNYKKSILAAYQAGKLDPFKDEYKRIQLALNAGDEGIARNISIDILKRVPGHPSASYTLGFLAGQKNMHEDQVRILKQCLYHHPANIPVRKAIIHSYEESGELGKALDEAELLLKIDAKFDGYIAKCRILTRMCRYEEALACVDTAPIHHQSDGEIPGSLQVMRAKLLRTLGARKKCEEVFKLCTMVPSVCGEGWWGLADLKNYRFSRPELSTIEQQRDQNGVSIKQHAMMAFALGRHFDNEGEHEEAFSYYKTANKLYENREFDLTKYARYCENMRKVTKTAGSGCQAELNPQGPVPIFVVGMPRSGSTLIEQILSSHSQIEGTIELLEIPHLIRKINSSGLKTYDLAFPRCLGEFSETELHEFGQEYIERTGDYRSDKPYFIDKLPANFENIGLIHKILPHAVVIDARRHPLDCAYSIFRQLFTIGHGYSFSLEDIGTYYREYLKFMDHWDTLLPGKIHCTQYENLINDTETEVKRLLQHIGVPFEQSCLEFYKNKRAVSTVSSEQVRQPINKKGIGNWLPVKDRLGPLIESLGQETLKRFEKYLPANSRDQDLH